MHENVNGNEFEARCSPWLGDRLRGGLESVDEDGLGNRCSPWSGAGDGFIGGVCGGFESVNESGLANRCWNSSSWLAVSDMIDLD